MSRSTLERSVVGEVDWAQEGALRPPSLAFEGGEGFEGRLVDDPAAQSRRVYEHVYTLTYKV